MSQPPSVGEEPMKGGSQSMSTIGFHNNVDWSCHQADYTDNLVWIECKFENRSTRPQRQCIQVVISNSSGKEVDRSRVVCSNTMNPGEVYENDAAFENTKHSNRRFQLALACGQDTSQCSLSTVEAAPNN